MTIFLVYHEICDGANSRAVSPRDLDRHLRIIQSSGATIMNPAELRTLQRSTPGFVCCFDDGTADHWATAAPILERHDAKAIFYVPTQKMCAPGRLTPDTVARLHQAGHTIAVHGHTHDRWDRLPLEAVRNELGLSRTLIREWCGTVATHAAPPGGWFTRAVVEAAKEMGFNFFRTMRWGVNRAADPYAIQVLPMTRRCGDWFIRASLAGALSTCIPAVYVAKCGVRAVWPGSRAYR